MAAILRYWLRGGRHTRGGPGGRGIFAGEDRLNVRWEEAGVPAMLLFVDDGRKRELDFGVVLCSCDSSIVYSVIEIIYEGC
jgi:hypothetical protein